MGQSDPESSNLKVHSITVGKSLDAFVPNNIQANIGDIITFEFFPPNHSVVRSEYLQPCIPYEYTGDNKEGFFSGFYPVDKVLQDPPTWNLTVNDTQPVFFYCSAPGSCQNHTMVGVINANSSINFPAHQADARESKFSLSPGEPFPAEGEVPSGDKGPVGTGSSSAASTSAPATTSSAAPHTSKGPQLSAGAIAGIVIAGLVVLALLAGLFFILGRQRSMLQMLRSRNRSKENHGHGQPKDIMPDMRHAAGQSIPSPQPYYVPYSPDGMYRDGTFATAPPQYPFPARAISPTSPPLTTSSPPPGGVGGPWELQSPEGRDPKGFYGTVNVKEDSEEGHTFGNNRPNLNDMAPPQVPGVASRAPAQDQTPGQKPQRFPFSMRLKSNRKAQR